MIPSSTQWESPNGRPAPVTPDEPEASLARWCAENGHVHEVIVDGGGRGVAVTVAELPWRDIVRVFRGATRADALTLATTWILSRGAS